MFYVGRQGQFDAYLHSELKEYPQINYAVVLAYMPGKKTEYDDYSDTMLPEGIESVRPHLGRRIQVRRKSQTQKESCDQSIKTS